MLEKGGIDLEIIPSKKNLLCKDKGAHDGYNDHHQRAK